MSLRSSSRAEVRKKGYKIGVDADEAQRRMEDNLFEIRKNKQEDNLNKKAARGTSKWQLYPAATTLPSRFITNSHRHREEDSFWNR
ncbi:hypothetical protein ACS0TY_007498 [Phlomoides rotata]